MAIQQQDDIINDPAAVRAAQSLRIIVCGASGAGTPTLLDRLADTVSQLAATSSVRLELADLTDDDAAVREIAAGGWNRELSILLTNADRGFDISTKRRLCLLSLLGVRKLVLAVNSSGIDAFPQDRFEAIASAVSSFQTPLDFEEVVCIPVSSLGGDNLVERSTSAPWYQGATLLECLQGALGTYQPATQPFRLSVDNVVASDGGAAGCAGTVISGELRAGDDVVVLPAGKATRVSAIRFGKTKADAARAGDAVVLSLADGVGISAGDVLAGAETSAEVSDQVAAHIVWTGKEPMLPSRHYLMKISAQTTAATITTLKYKINVETLEQIAGTTLERGEIAYCNLSMTEPVVFDAHKDNQRTGSFLLEDKLTGETVGAGLIAFGLRRATNIQWQALDIDKAARADQKEQKPCVLWFTGLSGSGKSTLANLLEKRLHARGRHTYVLDGDNVRHGLNKDLGFTDADRVENIRRVAETAKLMVDAGLIVMASFISPFRSERRMARELLGDGEFMEVFVDTPLDICEQRDPKGLYGKARAGLIKNFTGIDSDYEVPEQADIALDAGRGEPEQLVDELISLLEARNII